MKFRKPKADPEDHGLPPIPAPEHDGHTVVVEGPVVSAGIALNGTETFVAFSGFSTGGHAGVIRAIGPGLDHIAGIKWGGQTYQTRLPDVGFDEVIVKIDGHEYRLPL